MLEITVLGCGASLGVPVVACNCTVCNSSSTYNKRTRSSIFINNEKTKILVDFGFDIRYQLLKENITHIDAAILTHDHADHVGGVDELRALAFNQPSPLEIFTDNNTANIIESRYHYLFAYNHKYNVRQRLIAKPIDFYAQINIGTIPIQFFRQDHGPIDSLGIRIGDFVYSNDVVEFPEESKQYLENIKVWILDCLDYKSNNCHAGLDKILEWYNEYKPEKIFLTNMHHDIDYHTISQELPKNIIPLYDGYKISL